MYLTFWVDTPITRVRQRKGLTQFETHTGWGGAQSGRNGLIQAANTGQTDMVRLLIEKKANLNAADKVPNLYPHSSPSIALIPEWGS